MKLSRGRFILIFIISALVFQFASNSLLGAETRLFPFNGDTYPGMGSPTAWKNIAATAIYPVKLVLIGPLSSLFKLPDPPPPLLLLAFAAYWAVMALVIHFIPGKIRMRKKGITTMA